MKALVFQLFEVAARKDTRVFQPQMFSYISTLLSKLLAETRNRSVVPSLVHFAAMSDDAGSLPFAETRMRRHRPHVDAAMPAWEKPKTAGARLAHALGEVGANTRSSGRALHTATLTGAGIQKEDERSGP